MLTADPAAMGSWSSMTRRVRVTVAVKAVAAPLAKALLLPDPVLLAEIQNNKLKKKTKTTTSHRLLLLKSILEFIF